MNNITHNLMAHWRRATSDQRQAGANWYRTTRGLITRMARQHGVTRAKVAGVIAATSPRLHWGRNVTVSDTLLRGETPSGVFGASVVKARRIIAGAKPLAVLGGSKVRAFYRALMGNKMVGVVDVWMLRAAGLVPTTRLTVAVYAHIVNVLVALARRYRRSVTDLQATIWVVARGRAA